MKSDLKYEKANIELRRGKVLELLAIGYSQRSIAEKLNVSDALISLDIMWIKEKAKEDLRSHFQDRLPYEFARSTAGINDVLRRATELRDRMTDPKLQLQTMSLMAQLYGQIMNMASDGGVIQAAFEKVEQLSSKDKTQTESNQRKNFQTKTRSPNSPNMRKRQGNNTNE